MTPACSSMRVSLGAYVLGALDPADRAKLETHLAGCPVCREELAELAGLPGLLGRLTAEEAAAGTSPPEPAVLGRTLTELHRRRRTGRRRHRLLAAAAAVAFAAGGAGVAIAVDAVSSPPAITATGTTESATDPVTGVRATVTALGRPWGTALRLQLYGVQRGEHCQLIAVARDGRSEVAGSWQVAYTGQADITGATAITPGDLTAVRVVTTTGAGLVTVPVNPPGHSGPD